MSVIKENESTGTSLRTQWISLKTFRCRLNLPLHLRGNNLMPYYAPLSLSQDFWLAHRWKKYHSQAYRSKAGQICTYFGQTFCFLTSFVPFVGPLSMLWEHWPFFHGFLPDSEQPWKARPHHAVPRAHCTLADYWIRTQATLLLSLCLQSQALSVLDCKLHRQEVIQSSVRYSQKGARLYGVHSARRISFAECNEHNGIIGDVCGY